VSRCTSIVLVFSTEASHAVVLASSSPSARSMIKQNEEKKSHQLSGQNYSTEKNL
jgi:hypothetical protein